MVHAKTGNTCAILSELDTRPYPLEAFTIASWGDALCAVAWQDQVRP